MPALHRAPVGQRGPRARWPPPATHGAQRVRRDLPAVPLPDRSRTTSAPPGFEGAKYVCSPPLRPDARAPPRRDLWRGLRTNDLCGRVHRPLPLLLQGPEGARPRRLLARSPTAWAASSTAWTCIYQGVVNGELDPRALGRDVLAPPRRACSASTRARASSPPAPTPTSSSTTRTRTRRISASRRTT